MPKKTPRSKPTPATEARGAREARAWLASLGLEAKKPKWYVEINLDAGGRASSVYSSDTDTVFRLAVLADEWGFIVSKPGKGSHVRVHEEPFVHGRDDLGLLRAPIPELVDIGPYLARLEELLGTKFPRRDPHVRTNVSGAKAAATKWLAALI